MQTKLTLRLDSDLIETAKQIAGERGTSVSQLVAEYFQALAGSSEIESIRLPPVTESLIGSLAGSQIDESDWYQHLGSKHS